VALHGENLQRPTYRFLQSLQGGAVNVEIKKYRHEVYARDVVQKTIDMAGREDAVAFQEPRLLDAINHPRIVPVSEAQFDPQVPDCITFVMPYYPAGSIDGALIADYRFSLHQARDLACHVLGALGYLHGRHRYVHRDVKPGNVLLSDDRNDGYLSDFGSAAEMDANGRVGVAGMTPLYRAPEAGLPAASIDQRADLYSVGVTLFEMVNGRFAYEQLNFPDIQRRIGQGRRALADSHFAFAPHVPSRLRRVMRKAIAVEPQRRYANATQMISALNDVRCIDWKRLNGDDLEGDWEGTWPPHQREHERRRYRITSSPISRGRLRLEAFQMLPGAGWRRFGVPDTAVGDGDRGALEDYFVAVATRAAQLAPAR
jgi:serine/threonine protein kinase